MTNPVSVLFVEDNNGPAFMWREKLGLLSWVRPTECRDYSSARAAIERERFGVVFIDARLSDEELYEGITLAEAISKATPETAIIMYSGSIERSPEEWPHYEACKRAGALDVQRKDVLLAKDSVRLGEMIRAWRSRVDDLAGQGRGLTTDG